MSLMIYLHSFQVICLQSGLVTDLQWLVFFTSQLKVLVIRVPLMIKHKKLSDYNIDAAHLSFSPARDTRSPACHCRWSPGQWTWHPWGPAYTPARWPAHRPQSQPTPDQHVELYQEKRNLSPKVGVWYSLRRERFIFAHCWQIAGAGTSDPDLDTGCTLLHSDGNSKQCQALNPDPDLRQIMLTLPRLFRMSDVQIDTYHQPIY